VDDLGNWPVKTSVAVRKIEADGYGSIDKTENHLVEKVPVTHEKFIRVGNKGTQTECEILNLVAKILDLVRLSITDVEAVVGAWLRTKTRAGLIGTLENVEAEAQMPAVGKIDGGIWADAMY
jgi:hypothetical protein